LQLLQNVTDLLGKTFTSQFVFPALGHDDPMAKKELGKMWSRWLPTDSMHTFAKGKSSNLCYFPKSLCANLKLHTKGGSLRHVLYKKRNKETAFPLISPLLRTHFPVENKLVNKVGSLKGFDNERQPEIRRLEIQSICDRALN